MPVRLGVIADDLTGANDTGVQFARLGARTIVPLDWHNLGSLGRRADVLVLSTDSRALPRGAAAQRAKVAAQALRRGRVPAVYKKIDSTFRGNIGAELDAILDVYPAPLILLAPTFPPAGRAVVNGTLTVKGLPVHRTAVGRDPIAPVRQSHLPTLLRAQSRREVRHLPLAAVRADGANAAGLVRGWHGKEATLVVADAVTPGDLRRLARLIIRENLLDVVAGSAGLAAALGPLLPWRRQTLRQPARTDRPILVVVGSPNPTSLAQVDHAERHGGPTVIGGDIRMVLGGRERFRQELDRVLGKAAPEIRMRRDVLITLARETGAHPAGKSRGRSHRNSNKRIAGLSPSASATLSEFLGRVARDLSRPNRLGGLILCGGDIAMSTCRALGADGIILGGEVEAGVPWGRLLGGDRPSLPVITKAGGFGSPEVFRSAIRFLRRRGSH